MKRQRLSRSNGSKRKDRLTLEKQVQQLPNERLVAYAGISDQEAKLNPSLGNLKNLASAELEQRAKLVAVEKGGAGALSKTKSTSKDKVHKALDLLKKGVGVWKKALTGELAEDIESAVSEIGMTPEEKIAFEKHIKELKQKEAEREQREMQEFTFVEPVQETREEEVEERKPEKPVTAENVYDIIDEENKAMNEERNKSLHAKGNVQDWLVEGEKAFNEDRKVLGMDQDRHHGRTKEEDAYDMINEGHDFVAYERALAFGDKLPVEKKHHKKRKAKKPKVVVRYVPVPYGYGQQPYSPYPYQRRFV